MDLQLELAEKQLAIVMKKGELAALEQEVKILEIKLGKKRSSIDEEERAKGSYYVVTKGPKMGIYEKEASVRDLPSSYYAKANSRFEAELIMKQTKATTFQPRIGGFNPSLAMEYQSRLVTTTITQDQWISFYKSLISMNAEQRVVPVMCQEHLKAIALENIDPELMSKIFSAGLLDTVYPSGSLLEFSLMPKVKHALGVYMERSKLRIQGRSLYVKIYSTIPDWYDGFDYQAYHLIRIGPAGNFINPDKPCTIEEEIIPEILMQKRLDGFYFILKELEKVKEDSYVKVTYCSSHIIILSKFNRLISSEDLARVRKWESLILNEQVNVGKETLAKLKEVKGEAAISDMEQDAEG